MTKNGNIMLVDDEKLVRLAYKKDLETQGYDVDTFEDAEKALANISPAWPGILVTDVIMPGMDGLTLLQKVKEVDSDIPVILMTGKGDIPMAVQAVKEGAYDFLEKPFTTDSFLDVVKHSLEKRRLVMEIRDLKSQLDDKNNLESRIIGNHPDIVQLRNMIQGIAQTDTDILIHGETGSGKDMVANALHDWSARSKHHFVAINCGALPETIIESELFGHEAGSFTGANKRRIGKFEYAQGGTVYLDEIESMPLHLQVKLLRVLQERVIERLGANDPVPVDVKIIAATKTDLKQASEEGSFRSDLYYRLNVVQMRLPPLRERKEDIPMMFQHFLLEAANRSNIQAPVPDRMYMEQLMTRPWEGNVRELKNEAEKYLLQINLGIGQVDGSQGSLGKGVSLQNANLKQKLDEYEKCLIEEELARQNGNITKTHKALGLPRQTLCSKIKKFKLERKNYIS